MDNGRDRLGWAGDVWQRIEAGVIAAAERAQVASRFIPIIGPLPDAMTVPAESIDPADLVIDDAAVRPLAELWVDFALTTPQVEGEEHLGTAATLSTRGATMLSQAEDVLIFQGDKGLTSDQPPGVNHRNGASGPGLVRAAANSIEVEPLAAGSGKYGENAFEAVAKGYSTLQSQGHHGPYALVLHTDVYADSFAPLPDSAVMPAERIRPLVPGGFYGTGTVPRQTGLLLSVSDHTVDLVVGMDPTVAFVQLESDGLHRFRVFERFAVRLKDPSALVRFEFKDGR
jgi:uncharacterized linocin/CFP29 family protein